MAALLSCFSSPRVIHTVLKNSDTCPSCDILSAMVSSFLCFLLVIVLFYVAPMHNTGVLSSVHSVRRLQGTSQRNSCVG